LERDRYRPDTAPARGGPIIAGRSMALIRAAGGLLWRPGPGGPLLALVHRPRRGDWTLPKGKLAPGERWEEAALREVREETGCPARITAFAATSLYRSRRGPKLVLYWHMVLAGRGLSPQGDEVDAVAWVPPSEALRRLDRPRDRAVVARAAIERPRLASRGRSPSGMGRRGVPGA
jgi:8-oxo-dGTP diphosphatase